MPGCNQKFTSETERA